MTTLAEGLGHAAIEMQEQRDEAIVQRDLARDVAVALEAEVSQIQAATWSSSGIWLLEWVGGCTCGDGRAPYGHEPGCGWDNFAAARDAETAQAIADAHNRAIRPRNFA